jgi:hypothetical protein
MEDVPAPVPGPRLSRRRTHDHEMFCPLCALYDHFDALAGRHLVPRSVRSRPGVADVTYSPRPKPPPRRAAPRMSTSGTRTPRGTRPPRDPSVIWLTISGMSPYQSTPIVARFDLECLNSILSLPGHGSLRVYLGADIAPGYTRRPGTTPRARARAEQGHHVLTIRRPESSLRPAHAAPPSASRPHQAARACRASARCLRRSRPRC